MQRGKNDGIGLQCLSAAALRSLAAFICHCQLLCITWRLQVQRQSNAVVMSTEDGTVK